MYLHEKFPLPVLRRMRDAVAEAPADKTGMITSTIPALKQAQTPFRLSVNKDAYLSTIEAAIARKGDAKAGAR